ncbi:hypothetical protein PVAND_002243 [Polypedilum vanderplanki]|uniref:Major facilitator superfamily (MFS) profile domain-containing protein n=1 Tax=Polypedilum vanderplanki TaxID=319348 RepID=A0A9J6BQU9_POLVA|nr:hypothetical protein PVAND_002243 [Polypedilum vanderplanki]
MKQLDNKIREANSQKMTSSEEKKELEKLRFSEKFVQIGCSVGANLSIISSGMGLGYPAITSQSLLNELSESQISWFAAVTAILCPFGGLISGYLVEKFGRIGSLMIQDIVAIFSWLLIGLSRHSNPEYNFIQLMIARSLMGLVIGMSTTPGVMYTGEICDPKLRGRLTMLSSPFFTAFGMLLIYLLGYLIPNDFRVVSFYAGLFTFITLFVCLFIPESHVYLININKIEEAKKSLSVTRRLRINHPDIDEEIQKILINKNLSSITTTKKNSTWEEIKKPQFYKPLSIMIAFFTIQQFSGIFTIFIYAAQFSLEAGTAIDIFLSAVIIGGVRCCTTIIVAFVSDKFGRRPLAVFSSSGMCVCMLGIIVCSIFGTSLKESSIYWLPTAFLFLFIFCGTFGVLTLPFAMLGEMYPQNSKGLAIGLTIFYAYTMSFINVKTFTSVFAAFGSIGMFSFYAFVALIGVSFAFFILPETKGKSLQEIENYFRNKN